MIDRRWQHGRSRNARPERGAGGPVVPGLFRRMLGLSLLVHGVLVMVLLTGVRLHLPGRPPPEPRVTVKFEKRRFPQRPALERSRRAGPISRPLVRLAGQVRQPEVGMPAAGAGSRGSGGGAGGGSGEGLGDELGLGGGISGPVGEGRFPSGSGLGPLYTPGIGSGGGGAGGPGVTGSRVGTDEVDLGVELLGVEALDTGRHRAVVVVDPKDRKHLKGFLYLSSVYSESMERAELESGITRRQDGSTSIAVPQRRLAEQQTLQGLAEKMSARTGVRTQVLDALRLDDPQLREVPFLLLTALCDFSFTEAEAANLGRYIAGGGFLYAEVVALPLRSTMWGQGGPEAYDVPALRGFIRSALGSAGLGEGMDWSFRRLTPEHPLFHCYHEVRTLPRGFIDIPYWYANAGVTDSPTPPYLEEIRVQGRTVGLYSRKDYADFWAGQAEVIRENDRAANRGGAFDIGGEELPVYDLGVNVLVYALTREGGIAQRLVAAE